MARIRRTVEERWATFSGALLGVAVLTAALTGSSRTIFLWIVGLLTVGCIYGFARTFTPLHAAETIAKTMWGEWKSRRHPYFSRYQHFEKDDTEDIYLGGPFGSSKSSLPKAVDLKLRCEMNRLFRQERHLCYGRHDFYDILVRIRVPDTFLESGEGKTRLGKGRYVVRWYNEDSGALLVKQRVRSWGIRESTWHTFRTRTTAEKYELRKEPEVTTPKE